jgi:preprotein translocase subunit SecF
MALFQNANYDFIKWRWHAIAMSAVIIIAGIGYAATRGIPLGIDFSGGTIMVVQFAQPVTDDQVRNALVASIPGEQVI